MNRLNMILRIILYRLIHQSKINWRPTLKLHLRMPWKTKMLHKRVIKHSGVSSRTSSTSTPSSLAVLRTRNQQRRSRWPKPRRQLSPRPQWKPNRRRLRKSQRLRNKMSNKKQTKRKRKKKRKTKFRLKKIRKPKLKQIQRKLLMLMPAIRLKQRRSPRKRLMTLLRNSLHKIKAMYNRKKMSVRARKNLINSC